MNTESQNDHHEKHPFGSGPTMPDSPEFEKFRLLWRAVSFDEKRVKASICEFEKFPPKGISEIAIRDEKRASLRAELKQIAGRKHALALLMDVDAQHAAENRFIIDALVESQQPLYEDDAVKRNCEIEVANEEIDTFISTGCAKSQAVPVTEFTVLTSDGTAPRPLEKMVADIATVQITKKTVEMNGIAPSSTDLTPTAVLDTTIDPCAEFRTMPNLVASELKIVFVGDKTESGMGGNNALEITARGITKRIPYSMLGLVDRRQTRLNCQGAILLGFARNMKLNYSAKTTKKISRLNAAFQQNLGISGKLTGPYRKEMGYEPLCTLIDNTGAGDKRAQKKGEYRTDSSDENQEAKRVPVSARDRDKELNDRMLDAGGTVWLLKNDPAFNRDKYRLS